MTKITFTQREMLEIELALLYAGRRNHGTAGHNRLLLIAKMATALGFEFLVPSHQFVFPPDSVEVEKPAEPDTIDINGRKIPVVLTASADPEQP